MINAKKGANYQEHDLAVQGEKKNENEFCKLYSNSVTKWTMGKCLYPSHPVRYNITGPTDCGKSVFSTSSFLNTFNKLERK